MNWIDLSFPGQLEEIRQKSFNQPVVIFKHSTRCSISTVAKSRLEKAGIPANIEFYYLDLLKFRSISNQVAEEFNVYHESPQVLLIKNGDCIYDESHMGIDMQEILSALN